MKHVNYVQFIFLFIYTNLEDFFSIPYSFIFNLITLYQNQKIPTVKVCTTKYNNFRHMKLFTHSTLVDYS